MIHKLWNRLTKFSIFGFIIAIICLVLSVSGRLNIEIALFLRNITIIVLVVSVLIEIYGVYRIRRYSQEEALEIFHTVGHLIKELRVLVPILHTDYKDVPKKNRKFVKDERYLQIIKEFEQTKRRCIDPGLAKKLHRLFEQEKLMAKYNLDSSEYKFQGAMENVEQDILDYISTNIESR